MKKKIKGAYLLRKLTLLLMAILLAGAFIACSDGKDGIDGKDGTDGTNGIDGKNSYIVIFNSNGGTPVINAVGVLHGETIAAPATPTKTAVYLCKFDGWYMEPALTNAWDFAVNTVTSNITLYAKWVPYELGDTGPGGGKIYYRTETGFTVQMVTPDENYTAYYLEAAPANAVGGDGSDTNMRWATAEEQPYATITDVVNLTTVIIGSGSGTPNETQMGNITADIGMGRKNTALIVTFDPCTDYIHAAQACTNYSNNSKTDWFLPSIGELYWLRLNRSYTDLSNNTIANNNFWASSQSNNNNAWFVNFLSGNRSINEKNMSNYVVRAVRAF